MKKDIYRILLLFLINSAVFGQLPNWTVNENDFQYTMSFVGFLNSDGKTLISADDKVAAFVNGECRGVANLIYVESRNQYYAYLTVFSNANNETLSFKIYDSEKNSVKSVAKTINFAINEHYGDLFQAYSFASPALSSKAEITNVSFQNVIRNDFAISGSEITIFLNKDQNITSLNSIFDLSIGASIYIGTEKQISGVNALDYTNPIDFQVVSQDQTVVKQWKIIVKKALANAIYYKKEAVCYEGGVLKIEFPIENEMVVLTKEGLIISTQLIANGQTIFSNLNAGTYKISVGGNFKEIIINLKK
jgi:hypothetical protein